nr:PREDICTED: uncharacterized protein LOC103282659 [Anolis carolinensis]|eukprot:XP_008123603.1 PREDICTED: uncharacterized protein LOC103282659 [Anolis carolinensis]
MIKAFEKVVTRDIEKLSRANTIRHSNLSRSELNILNRLSTMPDLIWKPADKGGAIVLLNLSDYITEVNKHLTDRSFYKPIPSDPTNKIRSLIKIVCTEGLAMNYITMQTFDFLQNQHPRIPVFYILPKIHKGIIPPPGRPIVSGTSSILEPLAKYLDHFLQPFVLKTQSYIKDTTHFINIIESLHIPRNSTLMTLDITSLYTNVPLNEVRTIIKDLFDSRESQTPPTHFLMDLLDIVLENNYFKFDTQFYLQIWGVAMGSAVAPCLANLFVSQLETNHIYDQEQNPYFKDMIYYGRYIDDVFTIFTSHNMAEQFSNWINTIHPNIKFTKTIKLTDIHFLDVSIHQDERGLYVTNYSKPTDKNSILHFNSFHHYSLKFNLPYSQLLRIKKNNSKPDHYFAAAHSLNNKLKARGYPAKILKQAFQKSQQIDRSTLLKYKPKQQLNRIICPLTLTSQTPHIRRIINKHWHLVQEIPGCKDAPIIAHKRSKNLKDILIHSDFKISNKEPRNIITGKFKCGHCDVCGLTSNIKQFQHPSLPIKINLKNYMTCSSENVIYVIRCPCDLLYIGMTSRSLKIRIQEHHSKIKRGSLDSTLYTHFQQKSHPYNSFKFLALEKVCAAGYTDIKTSLLRREAFWIYKLRTITPHGLNDKLDLTCFL